MRGMEGWDDSDEEQADEAEDAFEESSARRAFRGLFSIDGVKDALKDSKQHSRDVVQASGLPEQKIKQLNILLLGETGVGKSTMINAFANYITFESMEEALSPNCDLLALLRMSFTHTDSRTFESYLIEHGEADSNEQHKAGQAVTQECRSYTFPLFEDFSVHIIDTPGIGDTRGVEQDQINFNGILAYLENYDVLHGICVLLKPNNARLSITFSFCIKELLCHLHKSASDNIVFLFTYTRGSCYSPGDTVVPLKALLKQVESVPPHVVIPFNEKTVYCVDNEGFRLVLASKKGFSFTERDKQSFSESWSRSAEQCMRMLKHFASIKPHNVMETVSLNHAARLVKNLQEPMATVGSIISENMEILQKKREELMAFRGSMKDLKAKIEVKELELKAEGYTDGAATVCTSPGCCQKIVSTDTGEEETRYKICHQPCESASSANYFGDKASWFCSAIDILGKCKRCSCSMGRHQRITYVPHMVATKRSLKDAVAQQVEAGNELEARRLQINEVKELYEQYEAEAAAIVKAAARFAYFFKNNAISTYNDSLKAYVDHQIATERAKPDSRPAIVERLRALLASYEENRKELERLARAGKGDNTAGGVMKAARGLYKLKHTGAKLRELVETVTRVEQRTAQLHEKVCPTPPFRHHLKRVWATLSQGSK